MPRIPCKMNETNTKNKQQLKKISKIVAIVMASLFALTALLWGVSLLLGEEGIDTVSQVSGIYFFPADYSYNIFEDEIYMSFDRRLKFTEYGETRAVTSSDAEEYGVSGAFFFDYFNYIINGDCDGYKTCFTEEGLRTMTFPDRFTMQMLYDINVVLYRRESKEISGGTVLSEIYEVSYRIFENNGTFRGDIPSGETRTLVYEVYISGGVAKINAIGYRTNAN